MIFLPVSATALGFLVLGAVVAWPEKDRDLKRLGIFLASAALGVALLVIWAAYLLYVVVTQCPSA